MLSKTKMVKCRNIAEKFYDSSCDIYEYKNVEKDNVCSQIKDLVNENVPCRRGYSTGGNINYAKTGELNIDKVEIKQLVKLFLPWNIDIRAGSFVVVHYGECDEYYEYSGLSLKYATHCEVLLKSVERWA